MNKFRFANLMWFARLRQRLRRRPAVPIRQRRGRAGEQLAAAYLRRLGYEIEASNVRVAVGELDLVARERQTLCFVEVRTASSGRFGSAAESITTRKRQHLIRAAQWYLQHRRLRWSGAVRFDVVAIDAGADGQPAIQLIRGAFEVEG